MKRLIMKAISLMAFLLVFPALLVIIWEVKSKQKGNPILTALGFDVGCMEVFNSFQSNKGTQP